VKPTSAGYKTYLVEPNLGGLKWMEGEVPTPDGNIKLNCSTTQIKIKGESGIGTLRIKSKTVPVCKDALVAEKAKGVYEITIQPEKDLTIEYSAI
jgi:alpha-L-rhamnosidase